MSAPGLPLPEPEQPRLENLDAMATLAWEAYAALVRTEASDASLRSNGYWRALTDAAHARFRAVYSASSAK